MYMYFFKFKIMKLKLAILSFLISKGYSNINDISNFGINPRTIYMAIYNNRIPKDVQKFLDENNIIINQ